MFSCDSTCFPGLLEGGLESYSNTEWNMLHVVGQLPKNFLSGSNCEFAFLSGCLEIYSKRGSLGSLRYACDKIEEVGIIDVLSKHSVQVYQAAADEVLRTLCSNCRESVGEDAGVCLGREFGAGECERFHSAARSLPRMAVLRLICNYR